MIIKKKKILAARSTREDIGALCCIIKGSFSRSLHSSTNLLDLIKEVQDGLLSILGGKHIL